MKTARTLAKELIAPKVQRGDSIDRIGPMGIAGPGYWAQIGGYVQREGKMYAVPPRHVVIIEVEGQKCFEVFLIDDLVSEIRSGYEQAPLWEEGA